MLSAERTGFDAAQQRRRRAGGPARLSVSLRNLLLTLVLLMTLAGCSVHSERESTKSLRVLAFAYEPFIYLDDTGNPAGIEYEILSRFAEENGYRLELIWCPVFEEIIPKLLSGEGDLIAAQLAVTKSRLKHLSFSEPYFPNRVVIVAPVETEQYPSLVGKKVAVVPRSMGAEILAPTPGIELVYGSSEEELLRMVSRREAFAMPCDVVLAFLRLPDYQDLAIAGFLSDRQDYAFALPRESSLKPLLDQHIGEIKADGSFNQLILDTFGDLGYLILSGCEQPE